MIDVAILAILQGVAEFLPISSSGHLVLGKALLGIDAPGLRLDVFLHVGTLLAVGVFYFQVLRRIVVGREWSYVAKIIVSAVPCAAVGFCFRHQLEDAFANPKIVGCALLFTGAILVATKFLPKGGKDVSFARSIYMGLAQAFAIIPGISRSGMTLAAARASGVEAEKSAEFSFLMSTVPIAGAAALQIFEANDLQGVNEISWGLTIFGCVLSAIIGYISLKLLLKSLKSQYFWLFGPYCLAAGLIALILI